MTGEPKVSLSNTLTSDLDPRLGSVDGLDDVTWDAVGFEQLAGKPEHFVVALGDSYASGEGAEDYYAWSDNNGDSDLTRNSCHQSTNAWIRKTVLNGQAADVGTLSDTGDASLDFHFLACSGAETKQVLPHYSVDGGQPPVDGEGFGGSIGQHGMVSQLDAGYLDENTTLVTLSLGGNDMWFVDILQSCIMDGLSCLYKDRENSAEVVVTLPQAADDRLSNVFPESLRTAIESVRLRAPNAEIAVFGYPNLFDSGASCLPGISDDRWDETSTLYTEGDWLRELTADVNDAAEAVVDDINGDGDPGVFFVDVASGFTGREVCSYESAINKIVVTLTPGDSGLVWIFGDRVPYGKSQESVHPTQSGTDIYAAALEAALDARP